MKLMIKKMAISVIAALILGCLSYFIYNSLYKNQPHSDPTSDVAQLAETQNNMNTVSLNNDATHIKEISKEKPKITASNNKNLSSYVQTPETYMGAVRTKNFAGPRDINIDIAENYNFPSNLAINMWALQGRWLIKEEKIIPASPHALIKLHFNAERVYLVANSIHAKPSAIQVLLNGAPIAENNGADVKDSQLVVKRQRLYEIVHYAHPTSGEITLTVEPEVELYSFTFL